MTASFDILNFDYFNSVIILFRKQADRIQCELIRTSLSYRYYYFPKLR